MKKLFLLCMSLISANYLDTVTLKPKNVKKIIAVEIIQDPMPENAPHGAASIPYYQEYESKLKKEIEKFEQTLAGQKFVTGSARNHFIYYILE